MLRKIKLIYKNNKSTIDVTPDSPRDAVLTTTGLWRGAKIIEVQGHGETLNQMNHNSIRHIFRASDVKNSVTGTSLLNADLEA